MRRVAFLSMDDIGGFYVYDDLLHAPLKEAGWEVSTVSWRAHGTDWSQFEVVVIRSTWDYQQAPDAFLASLEAISQSSAVLCNPLSVVQWNIEKSYLQALERAGVPIVPTCWRDTFSTQVMCEQFTRFNADTLIIKPLLSANADDTFRITQASLEQFLPQLTELFASRSHMIQPFMESILNEGEYSLFYFGGQYSHAICKRPAEGDFRVQEEHGGKLTSYKPDNQQRDIAQRALAVMPDEALYARVDLIRCGPQWAVMEMELIEPSLYFNMDEASPKRFTEAFVQRFGEG